MGDDGIYRKTEKGRTEIATRAHRLGLRERTLLIMVDDKTSRSGLIARCAHAGCADMLDALLAQDFIELAAATVSSGFPASPSVRVEPAPSAAAADQAPLEVSLTSAARFACRTLVSQLGPGADELTALVEKSASAKELATVLEKCRQIIQGMVGRQKADVFWAGVCARMPKT